MSADGLDLLAEPAAHLRAGVCRRAIAVDVVLGEELVQQLVAAAGTPARRSDLRELRPNGIAAASAKVGSLPTK